MYRYYQIQRNPGSSMGLNADLAVLGSMAPGGGNHFNCKQCSVANSLSMLPSHYPDMNGILFKRTLIIHPYPYVTE